MHGEHLDGGNPPTFKFDEKYGIVCSSHTNGGVKYYTLNSYCDEYLKNIVEYLNIGFDEWFEKKCMAVIEEYERRNRT